LIRGNKFSPFDEYMNGIMSNLKHPYKMIVLGAGFSTLNMGVGALAAGTIKAIIHQYPDADISILDYGKDDLTYQVQVGDRRVSVQLINIRFSKRFYLRNNIALLILFALLLKLVPFERVKKHLTAKNAVLKQLAEADFTASISGGDSFSDIYGLGRFLYFALPQILVLLMGKKLVLLPQTLGPYQSTAVKLLTHHILKSACVIYSRDFNSMNEVRELFKDDGVNEKLRFCYDVGFVIDPIKPSGMVGAGNMPSRGTGDSLVGVNVSGLLYQGGYDHRNMFGLRMDYRTLIDEIVDFLIRKKNASVMLVPHVFDEYESDARVCEEIYDRLNNMYDGKLFVVRGCHDQNEIKYIIGLCDYFVGSRMHSCIAALSQGIPTVSIAYSRKFAGVMETLGIETQVADPRVLDTRQILHVIDDVYERRDEVRAHLKRVIPNVQATVLRLFEDIGTFRDPGRNVS
jgi:colanic acid/amylovoran biosynthesis protein